MDLSSNYFLNCPLPFWGCHDENFKSVRQKYRAWLVVRLHGFILVAKVIHFLFQQDKGYGQMFMVHKLVKMCITKLGCFL